MESGHPGVAEAILATLREHHQLSIGVVGIEYPGVGQVWRIDASNAAGERWTVEHADYYSACVALAELVGFDLEE
ncbi:MAG TPA: hypothetical protein VD997_17460 [Phycisphaerales bacterium]|nr:hypothetical protein [Phycisphaerales bacterium]